jgi:hypothetical protein
MKKEQLKVGEQYRTKIGGDWQLVTLSSLRKDLPPSADVIVRTGAGNLIYRTPGQLRKP